MRLSQLIEEYCKFAKISYKKQVDPSHISGFELDLKQFCLYMRNEHIEKITQRDFSEYIAGLSELGWKANGIRPKCVAFRNMLRFARNLGLKVIAPELIPMPSREYKIPRVATDEEIKKVLKLCPKDGTIQQIRNRTIITFLKSTGCRNSEMCALNLSQLMEHFDEKRVVIKTAKSKGVRPIRELFWDDETHEDLKAWIQARKTLNKKIIFPEPDALFVGIRGWQNGKRITNSAVAIIMRKLSRKAGIPTLNAHSLRHYRGHELNSMGANNSNISGVLGHASLTSSFIYTQMSSDELKAAAKKYRK